MARRDPNQTYTYKIFGRNVTLPKGFELAPGVSISQNKRSVEEGFRKLQKWLKNPTPENWLKIMGRNNAFGYQIRNYLLDRTGGVKDMIGNVKGMTTANKVFDALNVKSLIKPADIERINKLTTGGKGENVLSIARIGRQSNIKYPMSEVIETIRNFQNGEAWLRANPDEEAVNADGKNKYRAFANAIRTMEKEQTKIGGFPFGNNSEKKLWAGLYRSTYRGDRIKIVGEFADGNLPINKQGKVDWKMTIKAGVPAWKRVRFVDTALPGQPVFTWNNFKGQVDDVFGEGAFNKITEPYDTQVKTGSKRLSSGETIKNNTKVNLLRAELFAAEPGRFKADVIPTEAEYNKYVNSRAKRFNITEVHHPDGIGNNPWKMEPVFRYANREIDKVSQSLKAGTISLDNAKLEIERINRDVGPIRIKLDDGYFGTKTTTQKATMQAAENYLDNFIKNVKGTKGACRILIGKVLGGPVDTCEAIIRQDPVGSAQKIANIEDSSTAVTKVKNAALGFLKSPGVKRFGIAGAVGAAVGAVKEFNNNDPTTYLSNEDQQKGMLVEMLTDPITTEFNRPDILDYQLPTLGVAAAATTAATTPKTIRAVKRYNRGLGVEEKPIGNVKTGAKILGRGLAALGTPAALLPMEAMNISSQLAEGDSVADIATDPLNYLGAAFVGPASTIASRAVNPNIAKILRLGINPRTLSLVSRGFGLPGLALSLGFTAYDKLTD